MKTIVTVISSLLFVCLATAQQSNDPSGVQYKFPITFIQNAGQWKSDVLYGNMLGDQRSMLLKDGIALFGAKNQNVTIGEIPKEERGYTLLRFVDPSKKMKAYGSSIASAKSNFYEGSDTTQWKQNVDNFTKVVYSNVWKNIDVEYGEENGKLTQTFIVKPGGRISDIRLKDDAANSGDAHSPFHITKAAMLDDGKETPIDAAVMQGANGVTGIATRWRDTTKHIFFQTEFSTFLWGNVGSSPSSFLVDREGAMYIAGWTFSTDFPLVNSKISSKHDSANCLFLAKLLCDGKTLEFSTFIPTFRSTSWSLIWHNFGYNNWWGGGAITFAKDSAIILTTLTDGAFPLTANAIDKTPPDSARLCSGKSGLCRISRNGQLLYASFFSPISDVAIDLNGNVYLAGLPELVVDTLYRYIKPFFITNGVIKPNAVQNADPYLAKLDPACTSVIYGTYIGTDPNAKGNPMTWISGIAVDSACNPIVIGWTSSGAFPVKNAAQSIYAGGGDMFVMKLNATASDYLFSTYWGGNGTDVCDNYGWGGYGAYGWGATGGHTSPVLDVQGNIFISGRTASGNFPLKNPLQSPPQKLPTINGDAERSIVEFSPAGDILYSTILDDFSYNGSYYSYETGICLDANGNILLSGTARDTILPMINPLQTGIPAGSFNYLTLISRVGKKILFSTEWGPTYTYGGYYYNNAGGQVFADKHGYVYFAGSAIYGYWNAPDEYFPTFNAFRDTSTCFMYGGNGFLSRIYIPYCAPDNRLKTTLAVTDSIKIDTLGLRAKPPYFTITLTIENTDSLQPALEFSGDLHIPDGVILSPTTQSLHVSLAPGGLAPRADTTFLWTVVVDADSLFHEMDQIGNLLTFRFIGTFSRPDMAATCLKEIEICEKQVALEFGGLTDPKIDCLISGPDYLTINASSNGYLPKPLIVACSLINNEDYAFKIDHFALLPPKGMGCSMIPASDTIRPGCILQPGDTITQSWTLDVKPALQNQTLSIVFVAVDQFGLDITHCSHSIYVPGLPNLKCAAVCPSPVLCDINTGATTPSPLQATLRLVNSFDTLQDGIMARIVLDRAKELILAAGDSILKGPLAIAQYSHIDATWTLAGANMPNHAVADTIQFLYRTRIDSLWKSCQAIIAMKPVEGLLPCLLNSPDSLQLSPDGTSYLGSPFHVLFTTTNTAKAVVALNDAHLTMDNPSALHPIEDTVQSLSPLLLNESDSAQWNIVASTSRFAREAGIVVRALDSAGNLVTLCQRIIFLPAIPNDLSCSLTAPDTLHYTVATDTYTPNPFPCTLTMDNKLDTAQQTIGAQIDLSAAPHLKLSAGEQAQKQITGIAAHSPASVSWQLEVAASVEAPTSEQVVVRYWHLQDTVGQISRTCRTGLTLEGQERIFAASCKTAGHDSIWLLEDHTVPLVAQVEYTISNNGNVPLTGCNAAIILPPMFYCANHADSIQSFGVIQPGQNVSRQWLIAVNLNLAQLAHQTIGWKWSCDSLQSVPPCEHYIQPVLGEPSRIVVSPWKLRFRAEEGKALPASQAVDLHVPASIAWQLQSATPWLDFAPTSGSQTTSITVRPNTTAMPVALYNGTVGITPALLVSPQASIEVEYEISLTSSTSLTAQPNATSLSQSYPNPVGGTSRVASGEWRVVIGFSLEKESYASIRLYDMLGRFMATVFDGNASAGAQRVWFDASALRPGVYTYVLTAGVKMFSKVMVVVK